MNIQKFKTDLEFAIKNRYSIKIYYTDEIDVDRLISCLISKGWNNIPNI